MSHLTIRKISTQFPLTSFCCSTYRYNLYPNHHYTQGKPIVIIISFIPLNFPSLTATASSNSKHTLSLAILPNTSIKTLRNSPRKCKYYFFNRQLYVAKFNWGKEEKWQRADGGVISRLPFSTSKHFSSCSTRSH